jgi:hypothetical protein
MIIRVLAAPDYLDLPTFDEVFRTILGWDGLGFMFRVHGQEYNSFRRRARSKTLRDFQLRSQEKFLYTNMKPVPSDVHGLPRGGVAAKSLRVAIH